MSAQPHTLGSLVEAAQFDLTFEIPELAYERQAHLDRFVQDHLLPVIDQVMGEADADGWVVTVESLEVDLGAFTDQQFEREAPERLRHRLREVLLDALARVEVSTAPGTHARRETHGAYELRVLLGFLESGRIGARQMTADALTALGRRVLTEQFDQVISVLRHHPMQTRALVRLQRQFPGAPARAVVAAVLRDGSTEVEEGPTPPVPTPMDHGVASDERQAAAGATRAQGDRADDLSVASAVGLPAPMNPKRDAKHDGTGGGHEGIPPQATAVSTSASRNDGAIDAHPQRLQALADYELVVDWLLPQTLRNMGQATQERGHIDAQSVRRRAEHLALHHPLFVARLRRALRDAQLPAPTLQSRLPMEVWRQLIASLMVERRGSNATVGDGHGRAVRELAADPSLDWASLLRAFLTPRREGERSTRAGLATQRMDPPSGHGDRGAGHGPTRTVVGDRVPAPSAGTPPSRGRFAAEAVPVPKTDAERAVDDTPKGRVDSSARIHGRSSSAGDFSSDRLSSPRARPALAEQGEPSPQKAFGRDRGEVSAEGRATAQGQGERAEGNPFSPHDSARPPVHRSPERVASAPGDAEPTTTPRVAATARRAPATDEQTPSQRRSEGARAPQGRDEVRAVARHDAALAEGQRPSAETASAPSQRPARAHAGRLTAMERLRRALIQHRPEHLLAAWHALRETSPERLQDVLGEALSTLRGRHLLADHLPPALLRELLQWIAGEEADALWQLASAMDITTSGAMQGTVASAATQGARAAPGRWVWRRLLFALVETGQMSTRASRADHVRSVLARYEQRPVLRAATLRHEDGGAKSTAMAQPPLDASVPGVTASPTTLDEGAIDATAALTNDTVGVPPPPTQSKAEAHATASPGTAAQRSVAAADDSDRPAGADPLDGPSDGEAFLTWLTRPVTSLAEDMRWVAHAGAVLNERPSSQWREALRRALAQEIGARRAALSLTEAQLAALLHLIGPQHYDSVLRTLDGLNHAFAQSASVDDDESLVCLWTEALLLFAPRPPEQQAPDDFASRLLHAVTPTLVDDGARARLRAQYGTASPAGQGPEWRRALARDFGDDPRPVPANASRATSHSEGNAAPATVHAPTSPPGASPALASEVSSLREDEQYLYVANAGVVLAAAYLPRLFSRLGLIEEGAFIDTATAERAVLLLQYLVSGSAQAPEHELPLAKLLCGVTFSRPVPRSVEPTAFERDVIQGLLAAMIDHWQVVGKTSVDGLREAFLQRDGALSHRDEGWYLQVEQRAYDMLLDRLPWSYSPLRLPWMDEVLQVQWR